MSNPSFFIPAALITNTSCELIVPIQCTLQTPNDGSASRPKQFVFSQTPGTGHCKMHYTCNAMQCNAMQCLQVEFVFLAYQGKVVQPKPARAVSHAVDCS